MAVKRPRLRDMSPWRRYSLTIPPDSFDDWARLAAPSSIITVFDLRNCYAAAPVIQPCERVAYRAGVLNMAFNLWCAVLLIAVAAWLLWELWNAVAPKPITDDFLRLLDDSFGRDWRKPRTWPWTRVVWAYGFTFAGVTSAVGIGLLISAVMASSTPAKPPAVRVSTSQIFRLSP